MAENQTEQLGIISQSKESRQLLKNTADKLQLSNFIGEQWDKSVCIPLLSKLTFKPDQAKSQFNLPANHEIGDVVMLDSNPNIKKESGNSKIPDALIVEVDSTDPSNVYLRPCDFKFNLQMANYIQVSPITLSELLTKSPSAKSAIEKSINDIKVAGKLKGDFKLADIPIDDQTQTDFLPLSETKNIRGVTGKFISPDTQDNRDYFINNGKIRQENVLTKQLNPTEIDTLLNGAPGQEIAGILKDVSIESMTILDQKLFLARVQATMKIKGITTVDDLIKFIEKPQDFPDALSPKSENKAPDINDIGKILGKILKGNLGPLKTLFETTNGQDKETRIAAITKMTNSFNLSPADKETVTSYFGTKVQ